MKKKYFHICWVLEKPQNGNGRVKKDKIYLGLGPTRREGGYQSQTTIFPQISQKWRHFGSTLDNPCL